MPNAITPIFIQFVPAVVRKWLTIITNVLVQGRTITGGAYSQSSGPQFDVGGPRFKGQGLLGIPVPGAVKKIIVKKGAEHVRGAIDTPEERELIVKEAVSHGLPPSVASAATAGLTMLSLYFANVDIDKAIADPIWFLKGAAIFIGVRVLMQWQTPGTSIVEGAIVAKENKD